MPEALETRRGLHEYNLTGIFLFALRTRDMLETWQTRRGLHAFTTCQSRGRPIEGCTNTILYIEAPLRVRDMPEM